MTAGLLDREAYQTTYHRDYSTRTPGMTGPPPQLIPAPATTSETEPGKRPRRRVRRATDTSSQAGGGPQLPGSSLIVGPVPGTQQTAPPDGDKCDQISETLRMDLPDGEGVDFSQWILSNLPEIVEKCCRRHQPQTNQVIEVLPSPARRKIRINVTCKPISTPLKLPQDNHPDNEDASTDDFVLDDVGLRQVHRSQSSSRSRRRRRSVRRAAFPSVASLESVRRPADRDAATTELIRRVLEEMFGPKSGDGGRGVVRKADGNSSRGKSRSCQTSPRLVTGIDTVETSGSVGGCRSDTVSTRIREGHERDDAAKVTSRTMSSSPSPRQPPPSPPKSSHHPTPQTPPAVTAQSPYPSPRSRRTTRCILDTLTESNRLLRQMSEFFRRAELNERIAQRVEFGDQDSPHGEMREFPIKQAEREGRITQRRRERQGDDAWLKTLNGVNERGASTGGGVGGAARSEGGSSRGDGPSPELLRHCSDTQLSAGIRQHRTAAEQGTTVRSPCGSPVPLTSPPPYNIADPAPSTSRSWASPQFLDLHSEDRPYRPLVSPPPRDADTRRSDTGTEGGPRTSSPVETAEQECLMCIHRQTAADIDSTDVLLNYDPWKAIENDFKTLLN